MNLPGCTLDEAFRYCAEITTAHYENFPVASLFLPEEKRPYIQAIYAFSRVADDFSDEGNLLPADRLARLQDWEMMLGECYEGRAEHPVFIALRETVERNRIPVEPLKDLLAAFRRDVTQNRYESFDDLLSYCRCSANPVGRLVLMLFGHRDEGLFALSDKICTALQLTNFWQDLFVDLGKDRLYVPLEDMRRFGYGVENWRSRVIDANCRALLKFEVERTRDIFYEGAELPSLVEKELQIELRMVWFGGMSILAMLSRHGPSATKKPAFGTARKAMILIRSLFHNDLSRYGRKKKPWDLT
jgi:hydroxysqualene synthase